jgi:hypothetical protein
MYVFTEHIVNKFGLFGQWATNIMLSDEVNYKFIFVEHSSTPLPPPFGNGCKYL